MIGTIISSYIGVCIIFYLWSTWTNKFKLISFRTFIFSLLALFLTLINYFSSKSILKFINLTILFIIISKLLFKDKLKKCIIAPILSQILYALSEVIFSLIMFIILKDKVNDFVSNYSGAFISNLSISLIVLLLSKLPIVSRLYNKLFEFISKINNITVVTLLISAFYVYSVFVFNIYYGGDPKLLIVISAVISILSFLLVYIFFKTKDDYYKINDRYNSSLLSLKGLEDVLTNQRIDNHENKNQLMTIRNMTKNKKVTSFIDSILNNDIPDDKRIMQETNIIPSGGLRGLIYSKLLLMNKNDIEYELDIASSVRIVDMIDYGDKTMIDICKVLGIFLDNAIEEVNNIDDKYIIIEMFIEDEVLNISITNTFDNSIDKSDIYKPGISTKGNGHGYGLSLVKKIIKNNEKLESHHEITDNEFTQILKVYK